MNAFNDYGQKYKDSRLQSAYQANIATIACIVCIVEELQTEDFFSRETNPYMYADLQAFVKEFACIYRNAPKVLGHS